MVDSTKTLTVVVEESAIRGAAIVWVIVCGWYTYLSSIAIRTRAVTDQHSLLYNKLPEAGVQYFSRVAIAKASKNISIDRYKSSSRRVRASYTADPHW